MALGGGGDESRVWEHPGIHYQARYQVLRDLRNIRPDLDCDYPHLCPDCLVNKSGKERIFSGPSGASIFHAFDYVVQTIEKAYYVVCVNCDSEFELYHGG